MKARRALAAVTLLAAAGLAACVRYEARPIAAPDNLAAIEARALDAPAFGDFLRANGRSDPWPPERWDLAMLTLAGFYYNPELDVARASWAVARAGTVSAGARPDPTVIIAPGYDTTTSPSVITPWILTLATEFTIETAGKRGHRLARAEHLSTAARLNVATTAWKVRSGIRDSLLELYAASRGEALLSRQQTLQESIVALMQRQLEAGAISSIELTRVRVELEQTRLALHDERRQQAEARARLATAIGIGERALAGRLLDFVAFDATPRAMPSTDARRQALVNRPDILGALAEYAASQEALQLEIAKQYPDVRLGPGYQYDQSLDKWVVGLGMSLPIFNRNKGPIAEATARRVEAAARFTAVQAAALGEIDLALAGHGAALDTLATTRSVVDERRQQARSTLAQYQAGDVSRLELDAADLLVVTAELAALDARVKALRTAGRLEDAMQSPATIDDWVTEMPARQPAAIER